MRKLIKLCMPTGLLIFIIYKIVGCFITIPDAIADPACIISVVFMLIGTAYTGWCFGKHKNPYDFSDSKIKNHKDN